MIFFTFFDDIIYDNIIELCQNVLNKITVNAKMFVLSFTNTQQIEGKWDWELRILLQYCTKNKNRILMLSSIVGLCFLGGVREERLLMLLR